MSRALALVATLWAAAAGAEPWEALTAIRYAHFELLSTVGFGMAFGDETWTSVSARVGPGLLVRHDDLAVGGFLMGSATAALSLDVAADVEAAWESRDPQGPKDTSFEAGALLWLAHTRGWSLQGGPFVDLDGRLGWIAGVGAYGLGIEVARRRLAAVDAHWGLCVLTMTVPIFELADWVGRGDTGSTALVPW